MNKEKVIKKYFHKVNQLTIKNGKYKKLLDELIEFLLNTDEVKKDLTTKSLRIKKTHTSKAVIISKEDIIVAGIEEGIYLLKKHTHLKYKVFCKDGTKVKAGQSIMELYGATREILAYERVFLNILQRFLGIATVTNLLVTKIENQKEKSFIAATRKTNWGLLDKKAVAMGGGLTHRLSLSDGVLVKDNHLLLLKERFHFRSEEEIVSKALEILLKNTKNILIEIEVEKKESISVLIEKFTANKTSNVLGILLDNFSPKDAKVILKEIKQKYDTSPIIFEASGGITKDNILEWAQAGVDVISLGALTHSAKAADISLDLLQ